MHTIEPTTRTILDDTLILAFEELQRDGHHIIGGACDRDKDRAELRAHGEVVERAALLAEFPRQVISREVAEAAGAVFDTVGEASLKNASRWVIGRGLCSGQTIALPAEIVLVGERATNEDRWQQSSVGTAAHVTSEQAIENGLLEWVERASVRLLWGGGAVVSEATDQLLDELSDPIAAALQQHGLFCRAWMLAERDPFRIAIVLVGSRTGQVTFGAAARLATGPALEHAFLEAISVRAALASPRLQKTDRRAQLAIRAAQMQDTFIRFLETQPTTEAPTASAGGQAHRDLSRRVAELFDTEPWVTRLPIDSPLFVERVFVPSNTLLLPARSREYILSPGYLE